eukprot:134450-Prorocentrum_minimum.AAC.1
MATAFSTSSFLGSKVSAGKPSRATSRAGRRAIVKCEASNSAGSKCRIRSIVEAVSGTVGHVN